MRFEYSFYKLCIAALWLFRVIRVHATTCPVEDVQVTEFTLDDDPRIRIGDEVTLDAYACPNRTSASPLVVLLCGAPVFKADYQSISNILASNGVVVLVLERLAEFVPGTGVLNFATSADVDNAIAFAEENQEDLLVDIEQIALFGSDIAMDQAPS